MSSGARKLACLNCKYCFRLRLLCSLCAWWSRGFNRHFGAVIVWRRVEHFWLQMDAVLGETGSLYSTPPVTHMTAQTGTHYMHGTLYIVWIYFMSQHSSPQAPAWRVQQRLTQHEQLFPLSLLTEAKLLADSTTTTSRHLRPVHTRHVPVRKVCGV